jgi:hypothetical protein
MRSVFLEEGKLGNPPTAAGKLHKTDHLQIHREFYIDGGVLVFAL